MFSIHEKAVILQSCKR